MNLTSIIIVTVVCTIVGISMVVVGYYIITKTKFVIPLSKSQKIKPFEMLTFAISLFLNIPLFFVAIYSLYISQKTYSDAQISGPKQQLALDGSRKALESVIEITKGQKKVLDLSSKNLEVVVDAAVQQQKLLVESVELSNQQLKLNKEQQRINTQKPKFEILLNGHPEKYSDHKIITLKEVEYYDSYYDMYKVSIEVRNIGSAVAHRPYLTIVASPSNIRLRNTDNPKDEYDENIAIFSRYEKELLPLFDDYSMSIQEDLTMLVPHDVQFIVLQFRMNCLETSTHRMKSVFQVKQLPKSSPTK